MRALETSFPATVLILCCLAGHTGCFAAGAKEQAESEPVTLDLAEGAEPKLRVEARWEPIAASRYQLHQRQPELFDYAPREPVREYAATDFRLFLPAAAVSVGDVWPLEASALESMLRQFHVGATTRLRYGSPGAFACLRALSRRYAEILFRFHGAVELVPGEVYLTLSQFTGHVLIDRGTRHVVSFFLEVPDRNTNADINAYGLADIVYIPRMDLESGGTPLRNAIEWADSISEAEASARLARSFYRFVDIAWTDLEDAIPRARRERKPLHVVLLFGALDDESC